MPTPTHHALYQANTRVWLWELSQELGRPATLDDIPDSAIDELASLDALLEMNACVAGDPDEVVQRFKAYEETGCDLLLCLVNPYDISHEDVMETIDLMGRYVIPEFE